MPNEAAAAITAGATSTNLAGTVVSSDYLGMLVLYVVGIGELQLIVTQAVGEHQFRTSDKVQVCIPADAWMIF